MRKKLWLVLPLFGLAGFGIWAGVLVAAGETTGTNTVVATACADASVPDRTFTGPSHNLSRDGSSIYSEPGDVVTSPGASDHQCRTSTNVQTYTIPTVTQTVTTTAPPPGTLRFRGDFESANPIQDQWNGAACENTGVPDTSTWNQGNVFVVTDVVAKGSKAARIDLPSDAARKQSCEMYHNRTMDAGGTTELDEWYSLSLRIPSNYTSAGWGLSIAQLNYESIWGAPLQLLGVSPNTSPAAPNAVKLLMQSGNCQPVGTPNPPGPGCPYNNGGTPTGGVPNMYAIPNSRFTPGSWNDLLIHVKWTSNLDGRYEVFHRFRDGSAWVQTVDVSGAFPTVQWEPSFPNPDPNWATTDKFGLYRGGNATALSAHFDNICSGTSRAVVEACL